jgi:hypothetical protein
MLMSFLSALIAIVTALILFEFGFYLTDIIVRKMSNLAIPGSAESEEE